MIKYISTHENDLSDNIIDLDQWFSNLLPRRPHDNWQMNSQPLPLLAKLFNQR